MPEIFVLGCLRETVEAGAAAPPIDVGKRYDIFFAGVRQPQGGGRLSPRRDPKKKCLRENRASDMGVSFRQQGAVGAAPLLLPAESLSTSSSPAEVLWEALSAGRRTCCRPPRRRI